MIDFGRAPRNPGISAKNTQKATLSLLNRPWLGKTKRTIGMKILYNALKRSGIIWTNWQ